MNRSSSPSSPTFTLPFPNLPPPVHRQVAMNSFNAKHINLMSLATEIVRNDPLNTPRHTWAKDLILQLSSRIRSNNGCKTRHC